MSVGREAGTADRLARIGGAVDGKDRADAFAVAQRARQRHHALDMAVAEPAAAVAADKREPASARRFPFASHAR